MISIKVFEPQARICARLSQVIEGTFTVELLGRKYLYDPSKGIDQLLEADFAQRQALLSAPIVKGVITSAKGVYDLIVRNCLVTTAPYREDFLLNGKRIYNGEVNGVKVCYPEAVNTTYKVSDLSVKEVAFEQACIRPCYQYTDLKVYGKTFEILGPAVLNVKTGAQLNVGGMTFPIADCSDFNNAECDESFEKSSEAIVSPGAIDKNCAVSLFFHDVVGNHDYPLVIGQRISLLNGRVIGMNTVLSLLALGAYYEMVNYGIEDKLSDIDGVIVTKDANGRILSVSLDVVESGRWLSRTNVYERLRFGNELPFFKRFFGRFYCDDESIGLINDNNYEILISTRPSVSCFIFSLAFALSNHNMPTYSFISNLDALRKTGLIVADDKNRLIGNTASFEGKEVMLCDTLCRIAPSFTMRRMTKKRLEDCLNNLIIVGITPSGGQKDDEPDHYFVAKLTDDGYRVCYDPLRTEPYESGTRVGDLITDALPFPETFFMEV